MFLSANRVVLQILPCSKRDPHDWTACPFSHPSACAQLLTIPESPLSRVVSDTRLLYRHLQIVEKRREPLVYVTEQTQLFERFSLNADGRCVLCADEKARRRDPRLFNYTGIACPDMKKVCISKACYEQMLNVLHLSPPPPPHPSPHIYLPCTVRRVCKPRLSWAFAGQRLRTWRPVPLCAQRVRVLAASYQVAGHSHLCGCHAWRIIVLCQADSWRGAERGLFLVPCTRRKAPVTFMISQAVHGS